MRFIWDVGKDERNQAKHGVSFGEAATAFDDPLSRTIVDAAHSEGELRFVLIGLTSSGRLAVVVHMERNELIRIISARWATKRERRTYEEEV